MRFQKYIKRFPAFTFLVMLLSAVTFLSSCEDEEVVSDAVVLESFGPAGVNHGDQIKFIGRNLDKVSSIVLPGVEVPSSQFTSHSPGLIELVVPQEAVAGKVVLKTSMGDVESKSMLSFIVPVEISSITPQARPGEDISIKGKLVSWIDSVTFSDGITVSEFVSKSLDEVVVTVPMEAQTGLLIFYTGGMDPLSFVSEEELIVTLPAVSSLSTTSIKHTENLTITGTDLDLITSIMFGGDQEVTEFVSQTPTQIVVSVPAAAEKGIITLKQASPVEVVTNEEVTIILPVATTVTPNPAVPGVDEITITGTNLDLVAELTLAGVDGPITVAASEFLSHSAEEIVLALPEAAKAGAIKYTTIHEFSGSLGANVVVPSEGPALLAITVYDDEFFLNGGGESWNGTADPLSTEQAYSGGKSYKFETTGDGGAKIVGTSVDASSMGVYVFSLYGGPGTDGKKVAIILGHGGNDNWGNYNDVVLVEGEWTEYRLDLSKFPDVDHTAISNFVFKPEGAAAGDVIYIDRVGFDPAGPAPLGITVYDDEPLLGGRTESWNATIDPASTEQVYSGTKSYKVETAGDGGAKIVGTSVDASTKTEYVFSLYGGPGTNGKKVAVVLGSGDADNWNNYNDVVLVEGEWTEYRIPLTSYPDVDHTAITNFVFKQEGAVAGEIIYIDRIGFD